MYGGLNLSAFYVPFKLFVHFLFQRGHKKAGFAVFSDKAFLPLIELGKAFISPFSRGLRDLTDLGYRIGIIHT